jgi:hypothetical protein
MEERRSPKPDVVGSTPSTPAKIMTTKLVPTGIPDPVKADLLRRVYSHMFSVGVADFTAAVVDLCMFSDKVLLDDGSKFSASPGTKFIQLLRRDAALFGECRPFLENGSGSCECGHPYYRHKNDMECEGTPRYQSNGSGVQWTPCSKHCKRFKQKEF